MHSITVFGEPIAQPRHRHGMGRAYLTKDHPVKPYRQLINAMWPAKHPYEGPLEVCIDCYFARPANDKKLPRSASWRPIKPDVDNLAKSVLDALNGKAWLDDKQVCDLRVRKILCGVNDRERVVIMVQPCGGVE